IVSRQRIFPREWKLKASARSCASETPMRGRSFRPCCAFRCPANGLAQACCGMLKFFWEGAVVYGDRTTELEPPVPIGINGNAPGKQLVPVVQTSTALALTEEAR